MYSWNVILIKGPFNNLLSLHFIFTHEFYIVLSNDYDIDTGTFDIF